MSFDSQHRKIRSRAFQTIYNQGVTEMRINRANENTEFRILPAFDPDNDDPRTSWLPSILPDDTLSDWGRYIYMSSFLGYGTNKSTILSPKTFSEDAPCPLTDLGDAISSDKSTWGYLMERSENNIGELFSYPSPRMVVNIVDYNRPSLGVLLGIMTTGPATSLVNFVKAKNHNPNIRELAKQNYLAGYANGDITDPASGMVLVCKKDEDRSKQGKMAPYIITARINPDPTTGAPSPTYHSVDKAWLSKRHKLTEPETYLKVKTYEAIVAELVGIYNRRSPDGFHEYDLLRVAFPAYASIIPKTPSAPSHPRSLPTINNTPVASAHAPVAEEPVEMETVYVRSPAAANAENRINEKASSAVPEPSGELESGESVIARLRAKAKKNAG